MPVFEPFIGLRFEQSRFAESVAPPYDVLSENDVRQLRESSPSNVTWIDVPLLDDGDDPYAIAATKMNEWISSGVLISDDTPSFTIYRMTFTDESGVPRTIDGVIGALEVVPEGGGGVLPHERTTPKASTDRLDLTISTEANLSPIWGLSRAAGLSDLLSEPGEQFGTVEIDGVVHTLERVSDPDRVAAIQEYVSGSDVLIADGHHRYGVARHYKQHVDTHQAELATAASTTMVFVNEMSPEQLAIAAIHRLYTDVTSDDLRAALEASYDHIGSVLADDRCLQAMADASAVGFVTSDATVELYVSKASAELGDRDLDGARLEHAFSGVSHTVTYQHGVRNVVDAVTSQAAAAGILIRPVPFDEIVRTAERGDLMPPKSTFFTPKLLTGTVIRPMR